jgi:aspartate/tyrosine/aromatic aminotransferase
MTGVPKAPVDALFGLVDAFNKDPSPKKVSLGIGAYRDNDVIRKMLVFLQLFFLHHFIF